MFVKCVIRLIYDCDCCGYDCYGKAFIITMFAWSLMSGYPLYLTKSISYLGIDRNCVRDEDFHVNIVLRLLFVRVTVKEISSFCVLICYQFHHSGYNSHRTPFHGAVEPGQTLLYFLLHQH